MFNTKLEVDRHVESCLKKINNETERNLRCFAFARLYFKVGEYEQARRFVSTYLTAKPLSAEALSFLGKTLEKLGKLEAAIDTFRRSLDIDPKQNSLVLKVCELLSLDNVNIDIPTLRSYCEKAQRIYPHNPVVYNLKERLVAVESQDPNDVTKLLLTELETRSTDVHLRIRLLRHLLQNNQIKEAYKHAYDIEIKNLPIFLNSLSWYEVVGEVLVKYQRENVTSSDLTPEFWMLLVSVLDKLAFLTLNVHFSNIKTTSECTATIFNLDQTLGIAAKNLASTYERPLVHEFLNHYKAQLCLHLTCLLFKQAKSDLIKFKYALNLSLPLLFAAYHTSPPELNSMWLEHSPENHKQQVKKWHQEASYRCSQAGHILQAAAKERKNALIEKANQNSTGLWREQLFKKVFITRDEQLKMQSSFFVTNQQLIDISFQLPNSDLNKYDDYAQLMQPDSLHNLVWICLNKKLSNFKCTVFDGLQYSVKTLNNCSANSLNVLDIEAFIYCTTFTVQSQLEESKNQGYYNADKPAVIPASITEHLGTLQQAKWLKAAYAIYQNDCGVNFSEVRLNLSQGIEVVRCVGNHGLDVKLLVMLAQTFAERSKNLTKQSEIEFNEARADLYWKAALPLLEKLQNNQAISYGPYRLFEYKLKEMPSFEILLYIDEAKLFNGVQLFKKKEYEKALLIFDGLKNPYASYYQAQIYKAMAEEQLNQNKENVTSEMRSQHIILLSRSRDCLYLTLDRLRDPLIDRKHILNKHLGTDIEKIERLLSRIDSDIYNHRNECDGLSDENVSSNGSIGDHANNFYSSTMYPTGSLTPHLDRTQYSNRYRVELPFRREARPSPERLDAQLRQMQASRDATMSQVLDQNRIVIESHRTLMEEFRWLKDAVNNITSSVNDFKTAKHTGNEELQEIKKSISGLKAAVDELQSFRDVTDLVQEMKKEIAELKKDQAKARTNQLSDEDLYVLDDEYGADYGINSNVNAFNPTTLYPNYQGRLPATYPPAALYPGVYPVYPYANLGLSQAGAIPFGQESQIPDFRALNLPQTLPQPNYGQPSKASWDVVQSLNLVQPVIVPQLPPQTQQSNIFRDTVSTTITTSAITTSILPTVLTSTTSISKAPINVVITSSDPLPKTTIATTQVLSVTIPPQHLKGNLPPKSQPHNYQIPLPTTSGSILNITPTIINQPPPVVTTQGLLSNIAPPIYSAIDTKSTGLGLQIEKSLNQSFNTSDGKANLSSRSLDEHDPCPDFKPIVPLPDEVPLNTGEENETVLFSERAKLFRFTNKEWRERGVGVIKILEDKDSGRVRIVMRRDQVHKICANHFLTKDMSLTAMPSSGRAFIWAANDFADQEMVLEKLCVRFKSEEEANAFFIAFENARARLPLKKQEVVDKITPISQTSDTPQKSEAATSLGGFIFTTTPTFKPKEQNAPESVTPAQDVAKASPFASFTFSAKLPTPTKLFPTSTPKDSSPALEEEKEFEPTAEFQPVVPLPELVEIKTGEENAEILFESHAKLLRHDSVAKEWKECGIGVMKLLKEHIIRLVMRRDQVLKLCCNHQLLKNMTFKKMPKNPKAVSWCAQDYSEAVMRTELFTIRFKSEEQADTFYKVVTSAQDLLDDTNVVKSEEKVAIKEIKDDNIQQDKIKEDKKVKAGPPESATEIPKMIGFGDKFKPKAGTWKCKTCYIQNEGKDHFCVACDTPKNNLTPKKTTEQVFSFGISPTSATTSSPSFNKSQFSFGPPVTTVPSSTSFVFGQKPISWGDTFKTQEPDPPVQTATGSWGDAFKPKAGSWECEQCLVRNDADKLYCISCEHPKDNTVPKKDDSKNIDSGSTQYTFGFPSTIKPEATNETPKKEEGKDSNVPFKFGNSSPFSFGDKFAFSDKVDSQSEGFTFKAKDESKPKEQFVFGSPQQHAFEFTPRSPRRHSSVCQGEEESDNFVEDEGDHIYFKPVIPLPNKIEVKTGEEEEEVLYCHRAKLFRFVDKEWKERGIGDIKILRKTDGGKLRVLMRREQVLKICLNHVLTSDIEYLPKDDKTWLFSAPDYSEGEINQWRFCIRFKTAEISKAFKTAIDDALKAQNTSNTETPSHQEDTPDVKFISETNVSVEEEQEAIHLKLPPKFMAYRQMPDCSCETCKKDDIILSELFKSDKTQTNEKFAFNKPVIFGTPTTTPPTTTTLETLKDILAKPKLFVSPTTTATPSTPFNTFSFSLKTETQTTPKNIFSQSSSQPGFANINFNNSPASGGNIFSTTSIPGENIFGSSKGTDIFTSKNLFAVGENKSLIGSTPPTFTEPTNVDAKIIQKEDDEPIFKVDSNLSFASISNMKSDIVPFGKKHEEGDTPFAFLGSGAPVFASKTASKKKDKSKSHSGDEGEESEPEAGDNHDPHFEPIVPLPDAIVVSTGEEEEVPVFDERAKLFRYDNNLKEWKERGVGQMKILHHPINGTYRFILRREQVHKVVLNMLITNTLDLQPMVTSDKAWLWCGVNHSDDGAQVEKLAIRFKNCELAQAFYTAAQKAISAVNEQQEKNLPSIIQNFGLDVSDEQCEERNDDDEEDDDDDDDYEEDERHIFCKKCCYLSEQLQPGGDWKIIGSGELSVYYDQENYTYNISMCDESGVEIGGTAIEGTTDMLLEDNYCIWKGMGWLDKNTRLLTLKADFNSIQDAQDFHCGYLEMVQYAQETSNDDK